MEFYPIDFVLHIINIVVLFVLVRSLAYKPVRKFMLAREEKIAAQLAEAESAQADVDALKAEYQSGLENAQQERAAILAEGRAAAEKDAEAILAQAQKRASDIVAEAHADAEKEAVVAMREAEAELASTAVELAGRVLCFHEAAKNNALSMNTELNGTAPGIVKCAGHQEGDAEVIRRVLENLTGKHLMLKLEHDDTLLGGFVAYIEGNVYDFSYASQLGDLQRRLG